MSTLGFNVHLQNSSELISVGTNIAPWAASYSDLFHTSPNLDTATGYYNVPVQGYYNVVIQCAGGKPIICVNGAPIITTSYTSTYLVTATIFMEAGNYLSVQLNSSATLQQLVGSNIATFWSVTFTQPLVQDAPTITEIQSQTYVFATDTSDTPDVIVCNPSGYVPATIGSAVECLVANTPLTTTPTLVVSSSISAQIKIRGTVDPPVGSMVAGGVYRFCYDGTYFQLENPAISGGGSSSPLFTTVDFDLTATDLNLGPVTVFTPPVGNSYVLASVYTIASFSTNFDVGGDRVVESDIISMLTDDYPVVYNIDIVVLTTASSSDRLLKISGANETNLNPVIDSTTPVVFNYSGGSTNYTTGSLHLRLYLLNTAISTGGTSGVTSVTAGEGGTSIDNLDAQNPVVSSNIVETVVRDTLVAGNVCTFVNDPLKGGYGIYNNVNVPFSSSNYITSSAPSGISGNLPYALCVDGSNNAYVTGTYVQQCTIGSTVYPAITGGNSHAYLACTDTASTPTWSWSVADIEPTAFSNMYSVAFSGLHVYASLVVSTGTASIGGNPYVVGTYILKYLASDGTFVASFPVTTEVASVYSVLVNNTSGNITLVIDNIGNGATVFGSAITQLSTNDYVISTCDSTGALVSNVVADGATNAYWQVNDASMDQATGDIYLCGYIQPGTVAFGAVSHTNTTSFDKMALYKFNSSGVCQWIVADTDTVANSRLNYIYYRDSAIYVTGATAGTSITIGGSTITQATNDFGIFARFDTLGVATLIKNNFDTSTDPFGNIRADASGNIYIGVLGAFFSAAGALASTDIFGLMKYSSTGDPISVATVLPTENNNIIDILNDDRIVSADINSINDKIAYPYSFTISNSGNSETFLAVTVPSMNFTYVPQKLFISTSNAVALDTSKVIFLGPVTVATTLTPGNYYWYSVQTNTLVDVLPTTGVITGASANYIGMGYALSTTKLFYEPVPTTLIINSGI